MATTYRTTPALRDKAGTGWSAAASNRFTEAFFDWGFYTDFDPDAASTGSPVYKDRDAPCWDPFAEDPGVNAVACLTKVWKPV